MPNIMRSIACALLCIVLVEVDASCPSCFLCLSDTMPAMTSMTYTSKSMCPVGQVQTVDTLDVTLTSPASPVLQIKTSDTNDPDHYYIDASNDQTKVTNCFKIAGNSKVGGRSRQLQVKVSCLSASGCEVKRDMRFSCTTPPGAPTPVTSRPTPYPTKPTPYAGPTPRPTPNQIDAGGGGFDPKVLTGGAGSILIIMGLVQLIVGPIMLYFGYRFFKIALFVLGGLPFGVVAYVGALAMYYSDIAALLIGVLAFAIGGALMVCCWFATIFCIGFIFGMAVVGLTSISMTDWLNYPLQSWTQAGLVIFAVFAVVFGCVGGYVAIKFQKLLIVIATSFFGAYFVFVAVFVCFVQSPEFPSVGNLFTDTSNDDAGPLLYLGGVVVLACTGVYVQYKKTSVGHDHTKATWTGQPHSNDAFELQQREGGMPNNLNSA